MSQNSMIPTEATADEIADLLALTPRRVRQIAVERNIKKAGRGLLPLRAVVAAVLEAAKASREPNELARAKAAREQAKGRLLEIEIQRAEGNLIDLDEHVAIIDELVGLFVTGLGALPARISRTDIRERRRVEAICDQLQSELAERAAKRSAELGKGRS